jgi:hypothetical protein
LMKMSRSVANTKSGERKHGKAIVKRLVKKVIPRDMSIHAKPSSSKYHVNRFKNAASLLRVVRGTKSFGRYLQNKRKDKASETGLGRHVYAADKPTTLKTGGSNRPTVSQVCKGDGLTMHPDPISPKHVTIYHNKPAPNDPDPAVAKFGRNTAVHRMTKAKAEGLLPKLKKLS